MPIEKVSNSSLNYYLIVFDKDGNERNESDGKKLSEQIFTTLSNEPITDVFLMSHGWMGDIPAAQDQYTKWISAMANQESDIEKIKQLRPGFKPLMIGLHWPSKPWGDEDLPSSVSFDVNDDPIEQLVDEYADRIANTEATRQALRTIFRSASEDSATDTLPPEVLTAYQVLNQEANLGSEGEAGAPGSDWEGFDPEGIYEAAIQDEPVSFSVESNPIPNALLEPLRLLSFWKMKERARQIGENAGFNLLKALQEKANPSVRFHVMGHSFGCIVASSILNGPQGKGILVRPVNSLALIQGAVSLWSYCAKISYEGNRPGYFHQIITQNKVAGPIITTYSEHDYAVSRMYPLAGKIVFSSVDFAPGQLPKYGGIGCFGIGGDDLGVEDKPMLPCDKAYNFKPGKVYNLNSNQYIHVLQDKFTIGAHNDINKPEVAHAVWSAACVS